MGRLIGLLLISLLLTALQCQRWTRYAKDIRTTIDPNPLTLYNDTISFRLTINCTNEKVINERPRLVYYAMSDRQNQELADIELTSGLETKDIKQKINSADKIKSIGVRLIGGTRYESPILPVSEINDAR